MGKLYLLDVLTTSVVCVNHDLLDLLQHHAEDEETTNKIVDMENDGDHSFILSLCVDNKSSNNPTQEEEDVAPQHWRQR